MRAVIVRVPNKQWCCAIPALPPGRRCGSTRLPQRDAPGRRNNSDTGAATKWRSNHRELISATITETTATQCLAIGTVSIRPYGPESLGIHVYHEVGVRSKERHLTFRIATIGAMCVGLHELPDSEAIRGFVGGEGNVFCS